MTDALPGSQAGLLGTTNRLSSCLGGGLLALHLKATEDVTTCSLERHGERERLESQEWSQAKSSNVT